MSLGDRYGAFPSAVRRTGCALTFPRAGAGRRSV